MTALRPAVVAVVENCVYRPIFPTIWGIWLMIWLMLPCCALIGASITLPLSIAITDL